MSLTNIFLMMYFGGVFLGFKVHTTVGAGQMVPQNFVQRNCQISELVEYKKSFIYSVNLIVHLCEDEMLSENLLQKHKTVKYYQPVKIKWIC